MIDYSPAVNVAVAIAAELTAAVAAETFVLDPTVRRGYIQDRDLKLENITTLRIDVQVAECESEPLSRKTMIYRCRTDICIREKFEQSERESSTGAIKTSEIDNRLILVQQIHDFLARDTDDSPGRRLDDMADAVFEEIEFRPFYYPQHLRENGQFTGIVSVVYGVRI